MKRLNEEDTQGNTAGDGVHNGFEDIELNMLLACSTI